KQVRTEADALPAEERQQEAGAEHENEHRRREQVQVREEAGETLVAAHVTDRVQMDERSDSGDEQRHRRRERVDEEAEVDSEGPRLHPGAYRRHVRPSVRYTR